MDDKILATLIQILQKHSDAIRKLSVLNIALADRLRLAEERAGVPYEEFERQFRETLVSVDARRPHDPQGIAKEIEDTVDELIVLRELARKPLN
jgi:hypothetical protein